MEEESAAYTHFLRAHSTAHSCALHKQRDSIPTKHCLPHDRDIGGSLKILASVQIILSLSDYSMPDSVVCTALDWLPRPFPATHLNRTTPSLSANFPPTMPVPLVGICAQLNATKESSFGSLTLAQLPSRFS